MAGLNEVNVKIEYVKEQVQPKILLDPQECPVTVIGQLPNLNKIKFDDVKARFANCVESKVHISTEHVIRYYLIRYNQKVFLKKILDIFSISKLSFKNNKNFGSSLKNDLELYARIFKMKLTGDSNSIHNEIIVFRSGIMA